MFVTLLTWFLLCTAPQAIYWMRATHNDVYPTDTAITDEMVFQEAAAIASGSTPAPWFTTPDKPYPVTTRYPIWVWFYLVQNDGMCFDTAGAQADCADPGTRFYWGAPLNLSYEEATKVWARLNSQWAPTPAEWKLAVYDTVRETRF